MPIEAYEYNQANRLNADRSASGEKIYTEAEYVLTDTAELKAEGDKRKAPPKLFPRAVRLYIICTVFGALASLAVLLLLSLAMWAFQLSVDFSGLFALLSFAAGCFVSGLTIGVARKRHGLSCGFKAGLILLALCTVGMIIGGGLSLGAIISKLLCAVACGCAGGVVGVNRE